MMWIVVFALTALAGLAFGGAVAEAFFLASRRRVSFRLLSQAGAAGLMCAPLLLAAGPVVLIRNSIRGYAMLGRPLPLVMAGLALGLLWSAATGWLLLTVSGLMA